LRKAVPAACVLLPVLLFFTAREIPAQAPPLPSGEGSDSWRETISVSVSSRFPGQGDPVLVEVSTVPPPDNLAIVWKGRTFPLKKAGAGRFLALIGIDLMESPGTFPLSVVSERNGPAARIDLALAVREKAFPVQELSLPKKMAEFDADTLDRIRREAEDLEARLAAVSAPAWDLPFLPPVEDYRPAGFGARRVINREPRSPHAGVDVHLPAGTPVRAVAAGNVAFSGERFFGGRSVVLDHGGGLFSVYYHLQETAVAEGQRVERGERIGAVGSSGRATGPHLHFGVRAAGGRVDPSLLFGSPFR
jgi:murein DD-endopeptidase MepM/ murein hydrolase activator NlpD